MSPGFIRVFLAFFASLRLCVVFFIVSTQCRHVARLYPGFPCVLCVFAPLRCILHCFNAMPPCRQALSGFSLRPLRLCAFALYSSLFQRNAAMSPGFIRVFLAFFASSASLRCILHHPRRYRLGPDDDHVCVDVSADDGALLLRTMLLYRGFYPERHQGLTGV